MNIMAISRVIIVMFHPISADGDLEAPEGFWGKWRANLELTSIIYMYNHIIYIYYIIILLYYYIITLLYYYIIILLYYYIIILLYYYIIILLYYYISYHIIFYHIDFTDHDSVEIPSGSRIRRFHGSFAPKMANHWNPCFFFNGKIGPLYSKDIPI